MKFARASCGLHIDTIHTLSHTRCSPLTPISPRTNTHTQNIQFRLSVFWVYSSVFKCGWCACAYEFGQTDAKNERFATASFISNKRIDVMGSCRLYVMNSFTNSTQLHIYLFELNLGTLNSSHAGVQTFIFLRRATAENFIQPEMEKVDESMLQWKGAECEARTEKEKH